MIKTLTVVALALTILLTGSAQASEKVDLFPSTSTDSSNWHRWQFFVIPFEGVAVEQIITVLWDTPDTAVLLAIYDTTDPTDLKVEAISIGNDRMARLEVGLLEGTYELVVIGLNAPTHYHMNVTYNSDEFLFRQPNRQPFSAARQSSNLQLEESLAPYVRRLEQAVSQSASR